MWVHGVGLYLVFFMMEHEESSDLVRKILLGKSFLFFFLNSEASTLGTLNITAFADLVCGLLWLLKYLCGILKGFLLMRNCIGFRLFLGKFSLKKKLVCFL